MPKATKAVKTLASVFPTGKNAKGTAIIIPPTPARSFEEITAIMAQQLITNPPKAKRAKAVKPVFAPILNLSPTIAKRFPTGRTKSGAVIVVPTPSGARTFKQMMAGNAPKITKEMEFPTGFNLKGTRVVIPASFTRTQEEIMRGPTPKKVAEAIKTIVASVVAPAISKATRGAGKKTPLTIEQKKANAKTARKRRAEEKKNDKN